MARLRLMVVLALCGLLLAACGEEEQAPVTAPDLAVDRQVGYAVVVDETGGRILIGFNADQNATSGDSYDLSQAVWRVEAGPWNEPPITCLSVGKRLELGISKVQNASQPGLLKNRVIWVGCLAPIDQ